MAIEAISDLGDNALAGTLDLLSRTGDDETHHSLLVLLSRMAEPKNIEHFRKATSRQELLQALLVGASESDPYARLAVVHGLAQYGSSSEAVRTLNHLAANDEFALTADGVGFRYPIREAASKALPKR